MKKRNIKLAVFAFKHYQGSIKDEKQEKKVVPSAISFKIHYSYFANETQTWSTMLRSEFGNVQLYQIYLFFQNHVNLYFTIYIYKNLQTFGWKLKLLHVQCIRRTNVLAYPWAKTEDNLVAKHANCGSQGSPMYKTSYITLWKFKQFSTRRRRRSEESTS